MAEVLGKEEAEVAEDGCPQARSGLCDQQTRKFPRNLKVPKPQSPSNSRIRDVKTKLHVQKYMKNHNNHNNHNNNKVPVYTLKSHPPSRMMEANTAGVPV